MTTAAIVASATCTINASGTIVSANTGNYKVAADATVSAGEYLWVTTKAIGENLGGL
jgi:hypothetical protein